MTIMVKNMFISSYVLQYCINKGQLSKIHSGNSNSLILAKIRVIQKRQVNRIKNPNKGNRLRRRPQVKNLKEKLKICKKNQPEIKSHQTKMISFNRTNFNLNSNRTSSFLTHTCTNWHIAKITSFKIHNNFIGYWVAKLIGIKFTRIYDNHLSIHFLIRSKNEYSLKCYTEREINFVLTWCVIWEKIMSFCW